LRQPAAAAVVVVEAVVEAVEVEVVVVNSIPTWLLLSMVSLIVPSLLPIVCTSIVESLSGQG
jgi:hypothetical protein